MPQNPYLGSTLPAQDAFAVTPADTDLAQPVRGIYVGGAGNVVVRTLQGNDVTFTAVPVGSILQVAARQIRAASTATLMVGLL